MFKDIPGFEGSYAVSNKGLVLSKARKDSVGRLKKAKLIKGSKDKDGYLRVTLSLGRRGSSKVVRVARLVALSWLPNKENLPIVNHKDGNKINNSVSNLEWCTPEFNTRHAWKNGLCKPYNRSEAYNREGIVESNKGRRKWFGTHKEYCKAYYERKKQEKVVCGI